MSVDASACQYYCQWNLSFYCCLYIFIIIWTNLLGYNFIFVAFVLLPFYLDILRVSFDANHTNTLDINKIIAFPAHHRCPKLTINLCYIGFNVCESMSNPFLYLLEFCVDCEDLWRISEVCAKYRVCMIYKAKQGFHLICKTIKHQFTWWKKFKTYSLMLQFYHRNSSKCNRRL